MDKVRIAGRIITVGLLLWAGGCGPSRPPLPPPGHPKPYCIGNTWYQPIPDASGFKQRGLASWYGKKFHGRKTANGEVYDMHAMTAAHKTLPLGTCVKVRNMENGRSVEVRINDRGPFITGRVIDLSYAGAKAIGLVGPGVAQVEVVALGKPVSTPKGKRVYAPVDYRRGAFTVQVGAFQERSNAERLREVLGRAYSNAHITTHHDGVRTYYRVRVGRLATLADAISFERTLVSGGYKEAMIVAE